jgi:hypothetical protein
MPRFRLWYFMLVLIFLALPLYAQDGGLTQVVCPEGAVFDPVIQMALPANRTPELPEDVSLPSFITVLRQESGNPIVSVNFTPPEQPETILCNRFDARISIYSATIPALDLTLRAETARTGMPMPPLPATMTVTTGDIDAAPGTYLMWVEGVSSTSMDDDGDVYDVVVSAAMVESGLPLSVIAFPFNSEYDPALTLVDAEGEPVEDADGRVITCDTAGDADACYGATAALDDAEIFGFQNIRLREISNAALLNIPLTPEMVNTTLRLRVDANDTEGAYTLLLYFGAGSIPDTRNTATIEDEVGGTFTFACADGTTISNAIRVDLPPVTADNATVTALGDIGVDPVLAVFNGDDTGECFDRTPEAEPYTLNLPDLALPASPTSTQAPLTPDAAFILVGNRNAQPGRLGLVFERFSAPRSEATPEATAEVTVEATAEATPSVVPLALAMPTTITGDPFVITISSGMAQGRDLLRVVQMAGEIGMNPFVAYVDENGDILPDAGGSPLACDDAGIPTLCASPASTLYDSQVTLAGGAGIAGFRQDALIYVPINPGTEGQAIRIVASSATPETGGMYVLIIGMLIAQ